MATVFFMIHVVVRGGSCLRSMLKFLSPLTPNLLPTNSIVLSRLEAHKIFLNSHKNLRKFLSGFDFSEKRISNRNSTVYQHSSVCCKFLSFNRYFYKPVLTMPPPGILQDWSLKLSPQDLLNRTDDLISKSRKLYDKVAAVPDSDVSFETVLKVLNEAECLLSSNRYFLDSSQHIAPDEGVRNASTEADRKLREFTVEIRMRKDIFDKLLVLQKKGEPLKPEAQRYLEKLILLGKRSGLHLDESTRKKAKDLNSKINNLGIDFMKNLNDVTTTLEFSEQELVGLSSDFLESLKKNPDTGKYEVTLKYPHYFPIMEKCKIPETRKRLEFAFNTQCIDENGRILTELRKLRHQLADLLGYPSHAAYRTEDLMSKSADSVHKFLTELAEKMTPLWKEEKKYLLDLKEKECAELGISFDGKLNSFDTTYYCTRAKEIKYAVDKTKLKEYFPFPVVKEGLLKIYQDLLGLKFEKIQGEVWHEDVELSSMHGAYFSTTEDEKKTLFYKQKFPLFIAEKNFKHFPPKSLFAIGSVSDSSSGTLLGYFFLDLFPRPNKYGHAALFELQHSFILPDGKRQVAVGAMVANFTRPKNDVPALMDHDEVTTFFHEFGHVMHYLCLEAEFTHFNIMNMERDFIEAPSQMLENWCWEIEPLKKMSSHYLNKNELPADMLNALTKSRLANIGHSTLRQIVLALYDQRIHTNPEGDTRDLYYDLVRKYLGIEPQAGTHFACHFGHLANEYDAQYYGYLWSEVYSMDMFETRFGGKNILNQEAGKDYRNKILRPGGTKDAIDLVCSFLGRKPAQEAFLRSKGLKV